MAKLKYNLFLFTLLYAKLLRYKPHDFSADIM